MLSWYSLNFLIQLKLALPHLYYPFRLIIPWLFLTDYLVFQSHYSYILVQVSSSSKKSINPVNLFQMVSYPCLLLWLLVLIIFVAFVRPPPPSVLTFDWSSSIYVVSIPILFLSLLWSWFLSFVNNEHHQECQDNSYLEPCLRFSWGGYNQKLGVTLSNKEYGKEGGF